jgi:hypothetical protein
LYLYKKSPIRRQIYFRRPEVNNLKHVRAILVPSHM